MSAVVGLIAGVCLEVDRDRAVGADRQGINQLPEIGAVVLAEPAAQLQGVGFLVRVGTGELDGGRIVVNLGGLDREGLDGLEDHGGEEAGAVSLEEPVQGATDGVIAQVLTGAQRRVVRLDPGFDAVERIRLEEDAFDQQFEGLDIVGKRDLLLQQLA